MNVSDEASVSLWMATAAYAPAPSLTQDLSCDVVIIGAGIAGLSSAYELTRAGKSVVVLDRGPIGGGMTSRTTAHLASEFDDYYYKHISLRSEAEARGYYLSQARAIDRIEEIIAAEKIDCDFARLPGYLVAAKPEDGDVLERERKACLQIGMAGVALVKGQWPGAPDALMFPHQARFHPLKYLSGLVGALTKEGAKIFSNTAVEKISEEAGAVLVETQAGHTLRASHAVVATNSPINDWVEIHTKQAPYRTYAIACPIEKGSFPDALFWDTQEPYHYVRLQPAADRDWLIVGGEDHKTGEADDFEARLQRLADWTRMIAPQAGAPEYRWSGQVMEPVDHAPYIGKNPGSDNVYVVTGDSGEGITSGVVASLLVSAQICGRKVHWAATYDPARVTLRAAPTYIAENVTVASNLTEYVSKGSPASPDELQPGQACVSGRGGSKVAAYRDFSGTLHIRSATCTHAGCVVHWNDFEKCWDCPCHGSQFSIDGEVLNGPAIAALGEAEE